MHLKLVRKHAACVIIQRKEWQEMGGEMRGNRSEDQEIIRKIEGGHGKEIGGNADGEREVGRVDCMKLQKKDEGADQNANRDSYRENRG